MIAWSHTRLSDYEACPLMFYSKHILKPSPFVFEQNAAMKRGSEIHAGYERAAIQLVHSSPVSPTELTAPAFPMLQAFHASHNELFIEEELAFTKDLKPCSWFDKKTWLRVKIDLAGRRGPKTLHQDQIFSVIDWKTGQYNVKEEALSQLRLSNLAIFLKIGDAAESSSVFVFVDQKRTSPIIRSSREQFQELLDSFSERVEAINISEERDMWPPKKNWKCKWCKVHTCRHYRG